MKLMVFLLVVMVGLMVFFDKTGWMLKRPTESSEKRSKTKYWLSWNRLTIRMFRNLSGAGCIMHRSPRQNKFRNYR